MRVTKAPPVYVPVTIVLETEDDYDKLYAILKAVATGESYKHHLVAAAKEIFPLLSEPQEDDG